MINLFNKEKVFCIGRNKTGTTTLEKVLEDLGYKIGVQSKGELLIDAYRAGNFKAIAKFCKTAEAFQDAPFSWPYTWLFLAANFTNAKFIFTIRDEESWYQSITRFHTKLFGKEGNLPTSEDLKNAKYRYPGFMWDMFQAVWKTPENDPYNKELLIANYRRHNQDVMHYFKANKNFIKLEVSKDEDYLKLCEFLNKEPMYDGFPHLNKTKSIAQKSR